MKKETKRPVFTDNRSENDLRKELREARRAFDKCARDAQRLSFELRERKKELFCQDQLSVLLTKPGLTVPQFLQAIADILPPAFQFPENASAIVVAGGNKYKSKGFKNSKDFLEVSYPSRSKPAVTLRLCYSFKKKRDR